MRAFLVLLIITISGCADENIFEPTYDIPEELEPIVDAFIDEAASRGELIEKTNLIIQYDQNLEGCGRCNSIGSLETIQKKITINPNGLCWTSELQKEGLLFHELGHCILGRLHIEQLLPNGDPKSLMVDDKTDLYTGCVYQFGEEDNCNNTFKREYYLDELFDPNTPVPAWAN